MIFDPDSHASPTIRVNHARPYLDKVSPTPNLPHPDASLWRKSIIASVTLPNLNHTGLRSHAIEQEPSLLRPDGYVRKEMRKALAEKLSEIHIISESRDIRDRERTAKQKRISQNILPANLDPWLDDPSSIINTKNELVRKNKQHGEDTFSDHIEEDILFQLKGTKKTRRPHSTASLATLLLDAEFGS